MKILKVEPNANHVQWIIPRVEDENLLDLLSFDCASRGKELDNIEWYIFNPKAKKGNFYVGINGALVFDQAAYDSELFTAFEMAGEILPINLENGDTLYILNVLECINILNAKNTVYSIYSDGSKGRILNYSFFENGISESSIFKIPETSRTQILTYADVKNPDDEFFYVYKESGLTGLIFNEIYSTP